MVVLWNILEGIALEMRAGTVPHSRGPMRLEVFGTACKLTPLGTVS